MHIPSPSRRHGLLACCTFGGNGQPMGATSCDSCFGRPCGLTTIDSYAMFGRVGRLATGILQSKVHSN